MSHSFRFDACGPEFKEAAQEFKEQVRDWADEAGFSCGSEGWGGQRGEGFAAIFSPRSNVYVTEGGDLVIELLLPGYEQDAVSISFVEDRMILKARAPLPAADEATRRYKLRRVQLRDIDRREYPVSAERYDQGAAVATYKSGILTVRIPGREGFTDSGGIKVDIVKEGN